MDTPGQPDAPPLERPERLTFDDPLAPRSPWSFWREAATGGLRFWGVQLILGWLCVQVLGSAAWALHLRSFAGFGTAQSGGSGLPAHWGEMFSARDLWELAENGGFKHDPLGSLSPVLAALGLLWVLWAGWRLQAESAGVPGRLGPWLLGLLDAVLIGILPVALVAWPVLRVLGKLGGLGFSTLGWLDLAGGTILRLAAISAVLLQWWLCRLGRAGADRGGFRMGSWAAYGAHLKVSFLRLWMHPIHWTTMTVAGTTLRLLLAWLPLWIGWRLGGGSSARVWLFLLLQALGTAAGAWLIGWFLRVAALFWAQDRRVRQAKTELKTTYGDTHATHA